MNTPIKILLGALLTGLLAWFTQNAMCNTGSDATTSVGATTAATPAAEAPATAEAVATCQTDINTLMKDKTINFQSGSAYLAADSTAVIDELAKALTPCAGTKVEIQGHTDLVGSADLNQNLSQQRAETVMKVLGEKGVPADRLSAKGYGATQPLENAKNPAANAKNRRTVFAVSAATTEVK
jgi:outer membrane protein OmpA-like peptidoglycan-associated protein